MIEIFKTPFIAVSAVYIVIALGMLCRHAQWISRESTENVLKVVVNLLMPCLIVSKIVSNKAFDDPGNLYIPPLAGFMVVVVGLLVGWLYCHIFPARWTGIDSSVKARTFAVCVGMINYGYVPIPLLADLYPGNDRLLAVLFVQNMGVELALWTLCVFMLIGSFDRKTLFHMLNIPTIAILGSILVNVTGLDKYIPRATLKPFEILGAAAIPMSLLFVGATIADTFTFKQLRSRGNSFFRIAFGSCFLRLLLLPFLMILLTKYLPGSSDIKIVMVVYASMASAIFPIVLTQIYKGDIHTALVTVLGNSLPALATTPLWIAFGLKYLNL